VRPQCAQIPQPIFTQDGLNIVNPCNDAVKIKTPDSQNWKPSKFGPLQSGLGLFSFDFSFKLAVSRVNTPYFSSEPHKSVGKVNRGQGFRRCVYFWPPTYWSRDMEHFGVNILACNMEKTPFLWKTQVKLHCS